MGRTPLHEACSSNDFELAKFLIEKCHANVHIEDEVSTPTKINII
jgi:hypothetical protein